MNIKRLSVIALAIGVSACTTAEEATQKASLQWVGQSSDQFFARFGAPNSQFATNDGGILYNWRGGETTIRRPIDQPKPANTLPNSPTFGQTTPNTFGTASQKSTTTVTRPNANTTITKTRSSSSSANVNVDALLDAALGVPAKPTHRTIQIYCELQVATNVDGRITGITKIRDTGGTASLSRCNEVLNK